MNQSRNTLSIYFVLLALVACGRYGYEAHTQTLSVVLDGDGVGRVVSTDLGIDCPGKCQVAVVPGTNVSLIAQVQATESFEGWLGACGGPFDCTVTVLERDLEVIARFRGPRNRVFVTSTQHVMGALGDLTTADTTCENLAIAAGFPGIYRAWLSTPTTDAIDRLTNARGWIRMDGLPFADTVADIAAGRIWHPITFHETGATVLNPTRIMTGSDNSGTHLSSCSGYTSTTGDSDMGSSLGTTGSYSRKGLVVRSCSLEAYFYCFEVSHNSAVGITSMEGRTAFVSATTFLPGGGLAAADAHCQAEADSEGLSGSSSAVGNR